MGSLPTLSAKITGDTSQYREAIGAAADINKKFAQEIAQLIPEIEHQRDATAKAAEQGKAFDAALHAAGISVEEYAEHTKKLKEEQEEATEKFEKMKELLTEGLGIGIALSGFEAMKSVIEGVKDVVIESIQEFVTMGNQIYNLSITTGLNTETIETWNKTASVTGVSAEKVSGSMQMLSIRLEEGNKKAAEGLERLHIDAEEFKAAAPDERLKMVAEAMAQVGIKSDAAHAAAKELFGRGGLGMLPAMSADAKEFRERMEGIYDPLSKNVEAAHEAAQAMAELKAVWESFKNIIAVDFMAATGLKEFIEGVHALKGDLADVAGGQGLGFKGTRQPGDKSGTLLDVPKAPGAAVSDVELVRIAAEEQKKADEAKRKAAEEYKKLLAEQHKEAMDMAKGFEAAGAIQRKEAEAQYTLDLKAQFADNAHYEAIMKQADAALKMRDAFKLASDEETLAMIPAMSQLTGMSEDALKAMLGFVPPIETAKEKAKDLKHELEQAAKALQGAGDIMGQLGGMLGGKGGGLLSGLGGVAGDAGGAIASLASGNIMGAISGGLKAVVGLVGTVKNLFSHPEFEKVMEDTGKRWGVQISEALAKQIQQTEEQFHIGRDMAELLNMDKIMGEAGGDPAKFKDKINNLMEAVKLGAVPAKEGVDQLGKAFSDLKTAADGGSVASTAAMVEMIKRAKELGETIPGMDEAIKAAVDRSISGLKDFYEGISMGGDKGGDNAEKLAGAQIDIFSAVEAASVAQYGLIDTVDKLGASFDQMQKNVQGGELTGGAAEFAHMKNLLEQDAFKGAAKGAKGLADVTGGLIESGNLTPQAMEAIGTSTVQLYNQAKGATGATELDALKAIAPELKEMQKAQALGAKLTPEEAKMLSDAQKAGILPLEDVATQQLNTQKGILAGVNRLGTDGATPGAPPSSTHAAEGFFSASMPQGPLRGGGTGLVVHPGEQVRVLPAGMSKGGWGSSMTTNLSVNAGTIVGDPGVLGDMLRELVNQGHEGAMAAIQQASWKG